MRWLIGGCGGCFVVCLLMLPGQGQSPATKPAVKLPLSKVVLFNAGIGYFHRQGKLDGPGTVRLTVDQDDVNDLLKTIVTTDGDGKTARSVTFDQKAGADLALRAFAFDLVANPTLSQLLHQARGESVQITSQDGSTVVGSIVSVEKPTPEVLTTDVGDEGKPIRPVVVKPLSGLIEQVNVLAEDGLQSVAIKQIKKVKFLNADLDADFRKALTALAASRNEGKKGVTVDFGVAGARDVSVGYIAEAPLWKPNYRLSLDGNTANVQAWATVENATDEDWTNVSVTLMSGRPMSFQMDLYDPLFLPRPIVEPEAFASLRPPQYLLGLFGQQGGGAFGIGGGGVGGLGGGGLGGGGFGGTGIAGVGAQGGGGNLGVGGGAMGRNQMGPLNGQFGFQGAYRPSVRSLGGSRLSYDEFNARLKEKVQEKAETHAGVGGGIITAATTINLGEPAEFKVAEPVSLPRAKTALLPIYTGKSPIERVCIYNAEVLANHPLAGLKLTNDSKQFLPAGPVAIFDQGSFAGEARLSDWRAGQSRFVSYAIDLLTFVQPESALISTPVDETILENGHAVRTRQHRYEYPYTARSRQDRTLIIEHPIRTGQTLVSPEKPMERSPTLNRFSVPLKAGEMTTFKVVDKAEHVERQALIGMSTRDFDELAERAKSPAVKDAIAKLRAMRVELDKLADANKSHANVISQIEADQKRLRDNMEKLPKETETFKKYVKMFDTQETEIEKRRTAIAETAKEQSARLASFESAAKTISAK